MKHRIFVALPVSVEIKRNVSLWQKEHADLPIRWISPSNLHITLVPPWYTEDIQTVHTTLKQIAKLKPIHLWFHTITIGPDSHAARLLWIEGKRNKQLIALKHQLEMTLEKQPEKRPFLPHITIGRLRNGRKFPQKKISEKISWRMEAVKFCLMESYLKRDGADYGTLYTYFLGE